MATNPLHHVLKSGRVLFLTEPLTKEEQEEAYSDAGNAILEALADHIVTRVKRSLTPKDAAYDRMLKKHGITLP